MRRKTLFWISLVAYLLLVFHNAFRINFFLDDFGHLRNSHISSWDQIIDFLNPLADHSFYRPLSTEFFYLVIRLIGNNVVLAHGIVFLFFFSGLVFLHKVTRQLTENGFLSNLIVTLYAVSATHVYQLYWLATFQEISLFMFLSGATYFYIKEKLALFSIFFFCALLSKEQAILFPVFLMLLSIFQMQFSKVKLLRKSFLFLAVVITGPFVFFYYLRMMQVQSLIEYQIIPSFKLVLNNMFWYFSWSLGFPSVLPDYFPSIFSRPLPGFTRYLADPAFTVYISLLTLFLLALTFFAFRLILKRPRISAIFLFLAISYFLFIFPALPIIHKWIVRLTIPLIFVSCIEGLVIFSLVKEKGKCRIFAFTLLAFYLVWNFVSVNFHERSSTYLYESSISQNLQREISENRKEILSAKMIFFKDYDPRSLTSWEGSKKLKLTFGDQAFSDFFFANEKIKVIYNFESIQAPKGAYIIESDKLLKYNFNEI